MAATLRGVWQSGLPRGERQRLCRLAVSVAVTGTSSEAPHFVEPPTPEHLKPEPGAIEGLYEEALALIGIRAGLATRPDIIQAKTYLRERAGLSEAVGHNLAAKLSKISKHRNVATHLATGRALLAELDHHLTQAAAQKAAVEVGSVNSISSPVPSLSDMEAEGKTDDGIASWVGSEHSADNSDDQVLDDIDSSAGSKHEADNSADQVDVEPPIQSRRFGKGEGLVGTAKKEEKQAHLESLLEQGMEVEEAFFTAFGRRLLTGPKQAVGSQKASGKRKKEKKSQNLNKTVSPSGK